MEQNLNEENIEMFNTQQMKSKECISILDDFYYENIQRNKLPTTFYRDIVELENIILINNNREDDLVEELAALYKKGVEHFSGGISQEKQNFYFQKLQDLLTNKKIVKRKEFSPSFCDMSLYSISEAPEKQNKKHKKERRVTYSNKLKLFFNNLKAKEESHERLEEFNKIFDEGIEKIEMDLEKQKKDFEIKLRNKMRKSFCGKRKDTQIKNIIKKPKTQPIIQEYIKEFSIMYQEQIIEKNYLFIMNLLIEIYNKKIEKFSKYEDQIKSFSLLSLMDEDENNQAALKLIIESLELDRNSDLFKLNNIRNNLLTKFFINGKSRDLQPFVKKLNQETINKLAELFK